MAKKKLIKTDAGNIFQNSQQKNISTSTSVGFQCLNDKNLKLCSEYDKTADGILIVEYFDDFVIPEYIFINGDNYKVTEIDSCSFPKTMKSIFIPASICKIENYAFWFTLDSILKEIHVAKDNKFYDSRENCNAVIETATNTLVVACDNTIIPDSVERISEGAFCAVAIKSLYIGPNIMHIDYNFAEIFGLESIIVSEHNKLYDSRENCNAIIETASNTLLKGCKTTIIPASVKRLGIASFSTTKEMESFCIPDNIELIEEYAFCNCDSLKNIVIPESVQKIEDSAFAFCGLTSVTINNKKAKIHKTAFDYSVLINGKPLNYWLRPTGKFLNLQKK
ncbi:MAG: leucine-rich repeat domain-containing protein [Bacteroidales bacterium]|nr:leucine-rich repeat domain-containing protein [Bacteroidales bacterium]